MGTSANRYERALISTLTFFSLLIGGLALAQTSEVPSCTLSVPIEGAISPATLDLFSRAQEEAKKRGCVSILVRLNTPGGSLSSARSIVEKILASEIPVLCLVSPAGGHAGSAGAFILLACHVNGAMPGTNIGAATPIASTGQSLTKDLREKVIQDTVSWTLSLAKLRGRSTAFAESIVTRAQAYDAVEAARIGAIDTVVDEVSQFLDFAQGRPVTMVGQVRQSVATGAITLYEPDLRARLLQVLTDPELAYVIFMLSLGLIYFEFTHPGAIAPGVAGAIGLIISLIAFQHLDVWWGGVAFIASGLGLILLEAFLPSFGALGIGGIIALAVGSVLLFPPGSPGLPVWLVVATTGILGALMLALAVLAFRTRRMQRAAAGHRLEGSRGRVMSLEAPSLRRGMVEVGGELWKFQSSEDLRSGDGVLVLSQEQLILKVKKET